MTVMSWIVHKNKCVVQKPVTKIIIEKKMAKGKTRDKTKLILYFGIDGISG